MNSTRPEGRSFFAHSSKEVPAVFGRDPGAAAYRLFHWLIRSPYRAKYSTTFFSSFFIRTKLLSFHLRPAARSLGIFSQAL